MNHNFQAALELVAALSAANSKSGPDSIDLARASIKGYRANRYGAAPKKIRSENASNNRRLSGGSKSWLDEKIGPLKYAVPIVGIADDLINDETGKSPANRVIDVLSRGNYASANAFLEAQKKADTQGGELSISEFINSLGKGAVEGFTGKEKTTFANLLEYNNPEGSNLGQGIGGFALDVFADPLTYVPVAGAANLVGKLGTKTAKPIKEATKTAVDVTKPRPVPDLQDFIKRGENSTNAKTNEFFSDTMGLPATSSRPTIKVGGEGVAEIVPTSRLANQPRSTDEFDEALAFDFDDNTSKLAAMAYNSTLDKLVQLKNKVPRRKYAPSLQVDNLYEDVIDRVKTGKRPVEVTEDITEDVTTLAKHKLTQEEATREAVRAALVNNPDAVIKDARGREFPIAKMWEAVEKGGESARKLAETLIEQNINRIIQEGKLPENVQMTTLGASKEVPMLGRTQALIRMLRGEKLPRSPKALESAPTGQSSMDALPFLEDAGAADTVFIKGPGGQRMTVRAFIEAATSRPVTKQQVRQVTKTISEDVFESQIFTRRSNFQEWKKRYADVFSPEELTYLGKANTKANFESRLNKVLNQKIDSGFANSKWEGFFEALDSGLVDEADLQELFKLTGAKSIAGLKRNIQSLLNKQAKANQSWLSGKKSTPKKAERFKAGAVPDTQWETPKPQEVIQQVEIEEFAAKPEDFVEAVATGDESVFIREIPKLSEDDARLALNALDEAVKKNLEIPLDARVYPFETLRTKAKKTGPELGKGYSRHINGWNSYAQSDQFRGVMRAVSNQLSSELKGPARASQAYDKTMRVLDAVGTITRKAGVEPVVGPAQKGYPLSAFEVLSALPRPVVEKFVFNYNLSVWPSKVLDAAYIVLREANGEIPLGNAKRAILASITTPSSQKKMLSPIMKQKNAERLIGEFADAMIAVKPALFELANKNTARLGLEEGSKIAVAYKTTAEEVAQAMRSPNISFAEAAQVVLDAPKEAARKVRARRGSKQAEVAAKALTQAEIDKIATPAEQEWIKLGRGMVNASPEKRTQIAAKQQSVLVDEIDRAYPEYDLSEKVEVALQTGLQRRLYPLASKFNAHFGQSTLRPIQNSLTNALQTEAHLFRRGMQNLHDKVYKNFPQAVTGVDPSELIRTAFRTLQAGETNISDDAVRAVVDQLDLATKNLLSQIPDLNGVNVAHLNRNLLHHGVSKEFFLVEGQPVANQWRQWTNVKNPLDLLDRYNAAVLKSLTEIQLGADFSARFGKKSPAPGYVRITDTRGQSLMAGFIDKELYYPKELAQQLHVLDSVLRGETWISSLRKANGGFRKWLEFQDSLIQAYKTGFTIYRPGHHVRNFVGDASLSFLAGVNNPNTYVRAGRVLKTRGKYAGFRGLDALRQPVVGGTDNARSAVVKLRNGKRIALTDDELYRIMHQRGLLVDYSTLEDTAYTSAVGSDNIFAKLREKSPAKGKIHNAAAGLSQLNAHLARAAHFIHEIEKSTYKSLDEAFEKAGHTVRKWHPDGSDLTNFEHDYMRRAFMFYSWVRKAIPLVLEASLMRPGRVMVMPKAQYNFAISMGIDPESLSNPFPTDQLFPDFLTSEINGPQFEVDGKYYGLNPGFAVNDVYNQFLQNDGWRGFAGTLNPIARIPIETANDKTLGLGTPIKDTSDYIDSQIPIVSNIASMTNRSVAGLGSPRANNVEYVNGRRQVIESFDPNELSMLNFLTGLGLRDMSKPNYIKLAEINERDRLRRQQ